MNTHTLGSFSAVLLFATTACTTELASDPTAPDDTPQVATDEPSGETASPVAGMEDRPDAPIQSVTPEEAPGTAPAELGGDHVPPGEPTRVPEDQEEEHPS